MSLIKNKIIKIYNSFKGLSIYVKIIVIISIIAGTAIRLDNLNHLGFVYDMVETQYLWATNGLKLGYFGFWRDYNGFFDYMPGSLLLLMGIASVGNLFGGSAQAFVTTLKLFNWTSDVSVILIAVYISAKYGKFSARNSYLFGSFLYLIPSLWFVSSVWGQIDTSVVLISLISIVLLYLRDERNTFLNYKNLPFHKDLGFLSGIVLGIGFWIKLQTVLVFPVLFAYFFSQKDKVLTKRYWLGFLTSSFFISIIPFSSSTNRVLESMLQPFTRGNDIGKGSSTFWQLIGMTGKGSDKLFEFYGIGPSVNLTGITIFTFLMIAIYLKITNIKLASLWQARRSLKLLFNKLFPSKLTIQNFIFLSFFCSSLYFMLFMNMHSRYLHMGIIFSFLIVSCMKIGNNFKYFFASIFILSISYFLNQVGVYNAWNNYPIWISYFSSSIKANFSSFLSTISILSLYLLVWSYAGKINENKLE